MSTKASKTRPDKACKPNTNTTHCSSCTPNCACKQKSVAVPEPVPELSIGEAIARKAISAMAKSKECKDIARDLDEQSVKDFLRVCNDSGNDPIAVVKQVAEDYKIDLSDDGRLDDTIQKDIRSVLMKVLIRFVGDATSFAAGEIACGNSDWKAILKEYINQRLGCVFKDGLRGYVPEFSGGKAHGSLGYGAFGGNDIVLCIRPIRYPRVVPVVRI